MLLSGDRRDYVVSRQVKLGQAQAGEMGNVDMGS